MFETNGSNALKREYDLPAYREEEKKKRIPKKQPAVKRGLSAGNKAAMVAAVLSLFALAFIVLMFKAVLNTEYKTLSIQKDKLSAVTAQVEQLTSELEGAAGVVVAEEKAVELGLKTATTDQIVYISLDDADKGEILAEDKSGRGIRLFFSKVAAIAEYLC